MQSDTNATAVCIGLDTDEQLTPFRDALAPYRCIHYRDVYRALARLDHDQPALVIVDVGWLPSVAFEFFDILARRHSGLPVLVSGPEQATARIRDALARGAHSRATPESIAECLPNRRKPDTAVLDVSRPASSPPSEAAEIASDTFAPAGNVFDAELDRRLNEQLDGADAGASGSEPPPAPIETAADEATPPRVAPAEVEEPPGETPDDDASNGPAPTRNVALAEPGDDGDERADSRPRVPWLRYADRPQRTPPKRTPPARPQPEPEVAPHDEPEASAAMSAPLLSEAELAALLGSPRGGQE
ncbi:MAG TPA: hypothetical protein P5572_02680 [Phycisphaerae bacterium]|nr:hypothetical protein [Phycisphaerales bacterium]HRX83905.1 hypothetical protein [Phycisphaerae bacterium]